MKRPSFQFYPADWLGNAKIRSVKPELRGAWIDVMCFLHQSDEYGVSRWPLVRLARAISCHVGILHSLVQHDILKGVGQGEHFAGFDHTDRNGVAHRLIQPTSGPIWFSSRMVVDEFLRGLASAAGKAGGGNPRLRTFIGVPKGVPKAPLYTSSSSPSSSSKRVPNGTPPETPPPTAATAASPPSGPSGRPVDTVWETVARLWFGGKVPAAQATRVGKIVRDLKSQGATPAEIDARLARYRTEWPDVEDTPESLVKHWARFDGARGKAASTSKVDAMARLLGGGP